uniref:Secreted protein n=1 Tax=Panagrellus redivivus TaxID=6233 RepID=A0A7E4VGC8_PANRE
MPHMGRRRSARSLFVEVATSLTSLAWFANITPFNRYGHNRIGILGTDINRVFTAVLLEPVYTVDHRATFLS